MVNLSTTTARGIRVRHWTRRDVPEIGRLYYETVHRVNARDYPKPQIDAWAPRVVPDHYWRRRFRRYHVYVAEAHGCLIGFAELESSGGIDCFYVHHDWQGQGVGLRLMRRIELEARSRGVRRLFADASITALPFFKKMGFSMVRRHTKVYRNRRFKQFHVERRL